MSEATATTTASPTLDVWTTAARYQADDIRKRSAELQRELLELRQQSWNTIDYGKPPKGAA